MILDTERLRIRKLTVDDAPFYLSLLNQQSFIDGIHDKGVRTLEQAQEHLRQGPMASYQDHGFGMYHLSLKSNGTPVGIAGLLQRDGLDHPDIGYAISDTYFGLGLATEACEAIMIYGQQALGLGTILGVVAEDNLASRRILDKLGLESQGSIELPPGEELLLYQPKRPSRRPR
ncbi:GNAT family N-acetyltransferase [Ferrimonas sp. SCSIO 43195]|uniref:GNAT family N-acetyltransferase n=1 Tax=Ferrimonas sp. SCSIO 43195 TaxID=2822844 RepID=UPI002075AB12|nr:GNAT family N-acetyltransferase [Ferrimonas sp. SCSIO 43195]USD36152.1 GNAT family N-acetyltransferase [Ferrimonas sp. SCSIO 43195]